MTPPPRILVVSAEHWPRALLRAQLDEAGYDAIGAGTLSRALRHPPDDAERAARNAPGVTEVENKLTVDPGVYVDV